jgi:AmmeMemoRadiSam system protein B
MCGLGAAVAGLAACRRLGSTRGNLVRYSTSGPVSGDFDHVVGYAGIVIH